MGEPQKIQDIWIRWQGPVMDKDGKYTGVNTSIGVGPTKGMTIEKHIEKARARLGKLPKKLDAPLGEGTYIDTFTQFVVCVDSDPFPIAYGVLDEDSGGDIDLTVDRSHPGQVVVYDDKAMDMVSDGKDPGVKIYAELGSRDQAPEDDDQDDDQD